MPIYARIAESAEETVRFMDVLAENIPSRAFSIPGILLDCWLERIFSQEHGDTSKSAVGTFETC